MQRNRAVALILLCLASPLAAGLGLGPLKATSALNEPFKGRIEILGAVPQDFDTLTIDLAGIEHFERAGIDRIPALFQLRFALEEGPGAGEFIKVTSKDPIREPFLNFLLEVNWANGRLLREYTVLLDPPLYDARRRAPVATAPSAPAASPPATTSAAAPTPAMAPAPARMTTTSGAYAAGSEIGPMVATDTLWSIASAHRPDESVTVQQMMLALLRENPAAFSEGNVNMLRRGAVLRLPDESALRAASAAEALDEIRRQHQVWEQYRSELGAAPAAQPLGAPAASTGAPAPADAAEAADARLELVAPGGAAAGPAPGSAGTGGGAELLREELDAQSQQNAELRDKLTEAEEIIDLLQRQVNIKDEELAALQARLAELGIEHGDAGAVEPVVPDDGDPMVEEEPGILDEEPLVEDADDDIEVEITEEVDATIAGDDGEVEVDVEREVVVEIEQETPAAGFPFNLIPAHIADLVPGGALTILIAGAVLVLGLFVGLVQFLLRGRSDDKEMPAARAQPAAAAAPALDDDETEDPTVTAGGEADEVGDDAAEAITTLDDEDATDDGKAFDPNATVEAEADEEAAAPVPAAPHEDPLEEVNVYLAYERFDQAEELVKRVIGEYPDRHEYKLRLLEVYYSSNDKAAYEDAARTLHEAVGESDPLWESAVAMWSEMSPERALFEEGGEAAAEPAADAAPAKAFVDITGEADDDASAGENTVAHAPGGPEDDALDFDLAGGDDDDDGILDLTATTDDGVLDLTATTDDDGVLDLTATTDADDGVLDITEGGDDDGVLDITEGGDDDGILDLTEGESDDGVLDITNGGADEADGDALDLTGGDIMDITAGDDSPSDLLDVTKTGDLTDVDGGDLLNVTSPGLGTAGGALSSTEPEDDGGLEITDVSGDSEEGDGGLDFDISDTVAPAFDVDSGPAAEAEAPAAPADDSAEDDTSTLEFDIGGLDVDEGGEEEIPTIDVESALTDNETGADDLDFDITMDEVPGEDDDGGLDLDVTMGSDELTNGLDLTETETEDGGLEITMGTPEEASGDGELSLQGSELDEIALDSTSGLETGEDEFDFSLDGTAEMDGIAADDTLDMASVDSGDALEIGEDASLDDLALELDAAVEGDDLGIDLDGDDEEHIQTVSLDADDPLSTDDAEQTVIMPVSEDIERQSDADEADTKLNLAKAYIELGDTEGARSILEEVTVDGNDEQKAEARTLLDQLAG